MLILLSGPIGSGKTTLCRRLVNLARRRGLCVAGVLAPAIVQNGAKVGIAAVDLRTGEARQLARCCPGEDDRPVGTRVGRYVMDESVLQWMVCVCREALADGSKTRGALVFIDEIGSLELNQEKGFAPLIPLLAQVRGARVIAVVRESLLKRLLARVSGADPCVVVLDPQKREAAWTELTSLAVAGKNDLRKALSGVDRY